jgi:hypothetical protein
LTEALREGTIWNGAQKHRERVWNDAQKHRESRLTSNQSAVENEIVGVGHASCLK